MRDHKASKFDRVFEQIDDLRERVAKIEVLSAIDREQLANISVKLDEMRATLNQIIGRDSVRATIYGVVGSIVSALVAWLINVFKVGNSN